ncbi:hypothetical protein ABEB36_006325 [Hypothenemus hampei]|uniref:Uncharacterized protein n=1 Tax=Hypothenemus hampei TaxID=57062 RepID=A0ABD1EQV6_HYPHA
MVVGHLSHLLSLFLPPGIPVSTPRLSSPYTIVYPGRSPNAEPPVGARAPREIVAFGRKCCGNLPLAAIDPIAPPAVPPPRQHWGCTPPHPILQYTVFEAGKFNCRKNKRYHQVQWPAPAAKGGGSSGTNLTTRTRGNKRGTFSGQQLMLNCYFPSLPCTADANNEPPPF